MHPLPIVTVDVVFLTLLDGRLHVALMSRDNAPFEGALALPGGYVRPEEDDTTLDTAYRVLLNKVGFRPAYLEQLCVFSGKDRDPRGWSVSIAHYALIAEADLRAAAGTRLALYPVDALPRLAFDHAEQIHVAVERVRSKSSYSTLPCWLLPAEFTLSELQLVYEQILGTPINKATFRARLGLKSDAGPGEECEPVTTDAGRGVLVPTDRFREGVHRPARLYRANKLALLARTIGG